jgi:predicted dehydrogenase
MSDTKLRIGVVGLGTFVEIAHMPTYFDSRYSRFLEVAGICDVNADRLKEWGQKYKIAGQYTSLDEMLAKANLDAVTIVTPDHTHTPIALKALAAGCDVLVEKPLAMNVKDCHKIRQAARQYRRRVITDFHKQEDPAHQEARTRVRSGRYGELQFGYVWMQDAITVPAGGFFKTALAAHSSPNWFLGVHFYDCVRFITGLDPWRVKATGYKQVLGPEKGINTYDAIKADVTMNNGAALSFYLSWNLPENIPSLTRQGIYFQFTKGEAHIDTRDRGFFESTYQAGYKAVNPMFLRDTLHGKAGYGCESIGEALHEFYQLKLANRANYAEVEAQHSSAINGFYATLTGQAVDSSLSQGQSLQGGQVVIGKEVDCNDLLQSELGSDAKEYLVEVTG